MKKGLIGLFILVCIALTSSISWGADGKIEITFMVGDDVLIINGKDVQVEKPVVINGVTLVPLRVITEAFGAEVNWDGPSRCVTLDYNGVLINLYIDNKEALVDNAKIEMLEAPKIINDRTMVPLRFITENFGADVSYDETTKKITVVKESANENSIKDFSLILKKTSKERVGDSYYGWSINYPKILKLSRRNFNGTSNVFLQQDNSYFILLNIFDKEEQTLDSILSSLLNRVKDSYTLINQAKMKTGEVESIKIVYKDESSAYEDRFFIEGNRIFTLGLYYKDYNLYKQDNDIQKVLDSFNLEFKGNGTEEDLSDVAPEGIRPYENKNMGYSLNVLADWSEIKKEGKENEISFSDGSQNLVYISNYSIDEGQTLDEVVNKDLDHLNREYNPEAYKLLKKEDSSIGGIDVKILYYTIAYGEDTLYSTDIYAIGKNYKYNFGFVLDEDTFNNLIEKEKVLSMLMSFKFNEPEFEELGYILDPDLINTTESFRTLENKNFAWSCQLPVSWVKAENNNDADLVHYYNNEEFMEATIVVREDVTYDEFSKQLIDNIRQSASIDAKLTLDSVEDVEVKGITAKKFTSSFKNGLDLIKEWGYILEKNGKVYFVSFSISDLRRSEKNIKILEDIWENIEFE